MDNDPKESVPKRKRMQQSEGDAHGTGQASSEERGAPTPSVAPTKPKTVSDMTDTELAAELRSDSQLNQVRRVVTAGLVEILGTEYYVDMQTRRTEFAVAERILSIAKSVSN